MEWAIVLFCVGVLYLLFRKKKSKRPAKSAKKKPLKPNNLYDIEISERFLSIESIDFAGLCVRSPDGRYALGWDDPGYIQDSKGRRRARDRGRLVLLAGKKLLYQVGIERPNDPSVANNGVAVVNDWLNGPGLRGDFYIFDRSGTKLIKHRVKANLLNCGISDEGNIAWCNTANSDNEDGASLFIFSISPPRFLFKLDLPFVSPESIKIEGGGIIISRGHIQRRYDRSGNLLNPREVAAAQYEYIKERGEPHQVLALVKQFLAEKDQPISREKARDAVLMLNRIIAQETAHTDYKASAHRLLGELAEKIGDSETAIENYRMALVNNPKVGVKMALARLEKASPLKKLSK